MGQMMGRAPEADLGGRKLARLLSKRISKAQTLSAEPTSTKKLKKAARQLKQFSTKLGKAVAAGKANAELGTALGGLATDAQAEITGLVT